MKTALSLLALALAAASATAVYGGEKKRNAIVPNTLSVTSCETKEFITVLNGGLVSRKPLVDWQEGDFVVPPQAHNWKDLEWNIVQGKLDCKHELVDLVDAAEIKGMPAISSDFSRHLICTRAGVAFAPKFNEAHPGWALFAVGCPNPIYDDNGTPDNFDDRIIGYKMPECPSSINDIAIKCRFSENEV